MANPWDRPPLPARGDLNPNETYAGVGRVLSQWEAVEIQLGYLYTIAAGKPGEWETLLEYGRGSAFVGRFRILEDKVAELFRKRPDQDVEAQFGAFRDEAKGWASRRHDVAHGIVRSHEWAHWWLLGEPAPPSEGFFLLPSHYKGSAYGPTALPFYTYTSASMHVLESALYVFVMEAIRMAGTMGRLAPPKP
jgi:hypothetical protein